jgi:hypothetical protein
MVDLKSMPPEEVARRRKRAYDNECEMWRVAAESKARLALVDAEASLNALLQQYILSLRALGLTYRQVDTNRGVVEAREALKKLEGAR